MTRRLAILAACTCVGLNMLRAQTNGPGPAATLATRQAPPASPQAAPGVTYVDATAASGLSQFTHVSGTADKPYLIEATGSGVAIWDFDNDGFSDIYLVNGSTLRGPAPGTAPGAPPGVVPGAALFRNAGNRTFHDVTREAGVANERWGQGVCAGDFDNDGFADLYVTNFGTNRLYRHVKAAPASTSAEGRAFEDIAVRAGVAVEGWSTGCAFGDFDGDGWLDLYVAGYVRLDRANLPPAPSAQPSPRSGARESSPSSTGQAGATGLGASYTAGAAYCTYRSEPVMCGPSGLPGAPDYLFRNNRDGTFTDVTRAAGVADTTGLYGFGVAWVDMDDDGRLDLIVANDSGPNFVYRNLGNGRFEDVSYASGAALDGNGRSQAHMGVAIGDYDNDGRADIHITNFADDFNVLYHNDTGPAGVTFSDVSYTSGLARVTIPFLGWGTDFLDYDNDGWLDLLVVNGHVYPRADALPWSTSYAQRALLFRNLRGTRFEEIGAAAGTVLGTPRVSRGSAIGDLDNDGGLDIVINNLDDRPTLARNQGGAKAGHWVSVRLKGDPTRKCPRDAIGSVVFLTAGGTRRRGEVASGRGQISQSDLRVHFGLGAETRVAKLDVRWANGETVTYALDRVDAVVTIDQATGAVTYDR